MTYEEIGLGMPFRIPGQSTIYITRGNGWYGTPLGYDGGPWTMDPKATIEPVEGRLHSFSFSGLNNEELAHCRERIYSSDSYGEGDRALIQSEYSKRNLTF